MASSSLFIRSLLLLLYVSLGFCTPVHVGSLLGSVTSDSIATELEHSSPAHSEHVATPSNLVVAHIIVGNTYKYKEDDWLQQIALAHSKGFDAFVLNVGSDSWQVDRVEAAFDVVRPFKSFKLFLSFDMTVIPCSAEGDAWLIQHYLGKFGSLSSYQKMEGKPLVSAFSGQDCKFGSNTVNEGWFSALKSESSGPVYFMPSFFVDPAEFSELSVMDGGFNWNSAWPMGNYEINFETDNDWIKHLGDRKYMAGISPWFFTHYSPQTYNKNFIYLADNWMLARRWELLIANRDKVPIAQVISWNDFGESHYLAPLLKDDSQPMSEQWVDGFSHDGWLDLFAYYIQAYKTGAYPRITRDRIFLWARLYPAKAEANDSVGPPTGSDWTQDYLWAIVLLTSPANVVLQCGSSREQFAAPAGLSKFKLPLKNPGSVSAYILRGDESDVKFSPSGFDFSSSPPSYNFNAFVAAYP
ncbi:glycoside hydrolase family 71 protein [Favolaschia claudopus]|uniref:Glycoside hydrolase family 71 protein n=1 Tax=Favolaschia claudopus TaxID=2862362 RepID=A0AAW0D758_9AGAR